jgi:hypothetical protein
VVKTRLRNEQLKNPFRRLQDASDVTMFLNKTLSRRVIMSSRRSGREEIRRYLHNILKESIPTYEPWNCDTIHGS